MNVGELKRLLADQPDQRPVMFEDGGVFKEVEWVEVSRVVLIPRRASFTKHFGRLWGRAMTGRARTVATLLRGKA